MVRCSGMTDPPTGSSPLRTAGWSMYRDACLVVEHRFDVIAELQRHSPGQPAGDDDVAGMEQPTLQGQLRDQPDDAGCRMA
jgi:hypothetical protein